MKENIFETLTKNQQSALKRTLRLYVKKFLNKSDDEIANEFINDEVYYKDMNNPHFIWILPLLEKEIFFCDLKNLIFSQRKYVEQSNLRKEIYQKQKVFFDNQKQKILEQKMKREKPTKKQLYYYQKLCEKYKISPKNVENLSKFDLKNMISKLLEH